VNEESFKEAAFILRDKGTNRRQFLLGAADKYTWQGFGSSYGMSDLNASILMAQLERLDEIQTSRSRIWKIYHSELVAWGIKNGFRIPLATQEFTAHIFWMLAPNKKNRDLFLKHMGAHNIQATFHYVPLHASPMGKSLGNFDCPNSSALGETLLRLPLSSNLRLDEIEAVIEAVRAYKFS
jgi:dTDP-4-amino-4,6-dideoxygalactose transaminase